METLFNLFNSISHSSLYFGIYSIVIAMTLSLVLFLFWQRSQKVNAATKYVVWWVVLTAAIILPLSSNYFPTLPDISFNQIKKMGTNNSSQFVAQQSEPIVVNTADQSKIQNLNFNREAPDRTLLSDNAQFVGSTNPSLLLNDIQYNKPAKSILLGMLPFGIFLVWFIVFTALLIRIILAYRKMTEIKANSTLFDLDEIQGFRLLLNEQLPNRSIKIMLSDDIDYPMAAGLGNPIVLIPTDLINKMTDDDLKIIISHELAHIQRWDDWAKLGQKLLEAVLFFNPIVHWIGKQLDFEREIACDDIVISKTGDPSGYAQCLTRLSQLSTGTGTLLLPGALTGRKQIFKRFERILMKKRNRTQKVSLRWIAGAFLIATVFLMVTIEFVPATSLPFPDMSYRDVQASFGETEVEGSKNLERNRISNLRLTEYRKLPTVPTVPSIPAMRSIGTLPSIPDVPPIPDLPELPAIGQYVSFNNISEGALNQRYVFTNESGSKSAPRSNYAYGSAQGTYWSTLATSSSNSSVVVKSDDKKVRLTLGGKVKFTDDFSDIKRLSQNGYVTIRDKRSEPNKELDIELNRRGNLDYDYYVDGSLQTFDDDAKEWMRAIFQELGEESQKALKKAKRNSRTPHSSMPMIVYDGVIDSDAPSPNETYFYDDDDHLRYSYSSSSGKNGFFDYLKSGLSIITGHKGETTVSWVDDDDKTSIIMDGDIEFNEDETGIESISKRGYISIRQRRGKLLTVLEIEPDKNGELQYEYSIKNKIQDFDQAGQEWLAEIIGRLVRNTGVNVDKRVQKYYSEDGVDGVLKEITKIDNNHVKSLYYQELMSLRALSDEEFGDIIRAASREIDSDYSKSEFLISFADYTDLKEEYLVDYVDMVGTIESDYSMRQALSAIEFRNVNNQVLKAILEMAEDLDSDYDRSELLIDMASTDLKDAESQKLLVQAIEGIDSDYEKKRVIFELLSHRNISPETIDEMIYLTMGMSSDYEKAELLIELYDASRNDPALKKAVLEACATLDSDYEMKRVLTSQRYDCNEDAALIVEMMSMLENMSSDYEIVQTLLEHSDCTRENKQVRDAYLRIINELHSDYEKSRALNEIINYNELDDELALSIMNAIEAISSDYEKSQLLKEIASYCRDKEKLEEVYLDIVDEMTSEYEQQQLYYKLHKRRDKGSSY